MPNETIYKFDVENRFPSYTVNKTTNKSVVRYELDDDGTLISYAESPDAGTAIFELRKKVVGDIDILPKLTQSQRDGLSGQLDGQSILNTDNFNVDTHHGTWYPTTNWIQGPVKTVTTTNATQTTIDSRTLADATVFLIRASILAVQSGGSNRGGGEIEALVYRTGGGNATIQGPITDIHRTGSVGAWGFTFTVSGNDIRGSVTGVAATTIKWASIFKFLKLPE